MTHLDPLSSWGVITLILAIVLVWLWFFLWAKPEDLTKSHLYSVRCVQCKWYAIAPTQLEAAQMYAKHYEADHS